MHLCEVCRPGLVKSKMVAACVCVCRTQSAGVQVEDIYSYYLFKIFTELL